jgi:hypothetical protein
MTMSSLRACGLAACAAVDIWLEGSLFATRRAVLEARGGRLAELAACRLCLSFHAAWLAGLAMRLGGGVGELLVAALAVSQLARIIDETSGGGSEGAGSSSPKIL